MSPEKAEFIKVPTGATGGSQTMPVQPEKRIPESEMSIELCNEKDAERIAEGLYACFPAAMLDSMEPVERRPPEYSTRVKLLAKRLLPSFKNPNMKWVKAVLTSSGEILGVAGWMGPGNRGIHNIFRRSAVDYYGWKEQMGWSDDEINEMWDYVGEAWIEKLDKDDDIRKELLGDEPHWFLAPLLTWPEYQGRGVGKKLMTWAIEQADATEPVTPMYLESSSMARAVYMHCGFVPQGAANLLRRGPAVVRGLEAEEERDALKAKLGEADVTVVAKETEADLAG